MARLLCLRATANVDVEIVFTARFDVMLLEAGCTDAEVASITGQSRQMVEYYSRQVNQRKLAAAAILKWERSENG